MKHFQLLDHINMIWSAYRVWEHSSVFKSEWKRCIISATEIENWRGDNIDLRNIYLFQSHCIDSAKRKNAKEVER